MTGIIVNVFFQNVVDFRISDCVRLCVCTTPSLLGGTAV